MDDILATPAPSGPYAYTISPSGRWRGADPAEARQRALMAVPQTESFFTTWVAVGWPLETADPLRLLADALCHLLAPAVADEKDDEKGDGTTVD